MSTDAHGGHLHAPKRRCCSALREAAIGRVVFVILCIGGEAISVGFRKAARMYWRWWVWPPFVIALVPIAFTLLLAVIQLAAYAVVLHSPSSAS